MILLISTLIFCATTSIICYGYLADGVNKKENEYLKTIFWISLLPIFNLYLLFYLLNEDLDMIRFYNFMKEMQND